MDYFNSKRKLNIFGEVTGDSNVGNIMADKLSIDLDKEKIIFEANQVLEKLLIKSNFKERIEKGEFS